MISYKNSVLIFDSKIFIKNTLTNQNIERDMQYYYQQYQDAGLGKKKFHGVKISELDKLEKCIVNV